MTFYTEKRVLSKADLLQGAVENAVTETGSKLTEIPLEAILCGMIARILNQEDCENESD